MGVQARTVAVWGSCVTRDAFALDARAVEMAERLPLRYYAARSSWISQGSTPWPDRDAELAGPVSEWGRRMVADDLDKTIVDHLIAQQPDLLVFDLIDERLSVGRVGPTWFTASSYLTETALGVRAQAQADEILAPTDPRRPPLFAAAAPALAGRLRRELPHTTFVLHEARFVTHTRDGGSIPDALADGARAMNLAQEPMRNSLREAFGPAMQLVTPPAEVCRADPDHRWGIASYHYVEAYYHWLTDALLAIADAHPADLR